MIKKQHFDEQTAKEMEAITGMIKVAEAEGLLCEVIYSLIQRAGFTDIPKECFHALNDWDC